MNATYEFVEAECLWKCTYRDEQTSTTYIGYGLTKQEALASVMVQVMMRGNDDQ